MKQKKQITPKQKKTSKKDKIFKEFGIEKNNYYNISYDINDLNKISKGVDKLVKKII